MHVTRTALLLADLILTAAIAGFFYAYSCSVLIGFDAAEPDVAIAAMQANNATIRNIWFAPAYFGPVFIGAAVAFVYLPRIRTVAGQAAIAAVLVYLLAAFLVTVVFNVPLNHALADAGGFETQEAARKVWEDYRGPWGTWNLVRTIASFLSVALLGLALRLDRAE